MSAAVLPAARRELAEPGRRSFGRWFLLPWLLLSVLGMLWALATPIGGSPDEPAHVVKAASVVRGELLPESMIVTGGVLHVPAAVAWEYQQGCFPFHPETPASCAPPFTGDPNEIVETYSSASLYNPAYYVLVGWPSLIVPGTEAIYAMRLVSVLLCSFFIAASFWMIGSWRSHRAPTLGVLIGLTPIVLYLLGTVNPNALEFAGGLALFTGMLGITLQPNPRLLGSRLTIVVIAAALVSNTRGISPLWVAVLLALPLLLLTGRELGALLKRPGVIVSILLIAITAVASVVWTQASNSLGTAPSSGPDVAPPNEGVGLTPLDGFLGMINGFYLQARQMVGILGWLDTTFDPSVYYISFGLVGLLVLGVLVWVRGRALVFVVALGLAFFFLPAIVQAAFVTRGGFIWQGRYTLVLALALLIGMAACIGASPRFQRWRRGRWLLTAFAWLAAAAWAYCAIYAFFTTLRRFTSGYYTEWTAMLDTGSWVPPLGVIPLGALFVLAVVGLAVTVVLLGRDRLVEVPVAPPAADPHDPFATMIYGTGYDAPVGYGTPPGHGAPTAFPNDNRYPDRKAPQW